MTLTCSKFFFESIQILLESHLHPYQANTGHNTGSKDDKSTEGITDLAAANVVSPNHKNKFNQGHKSGYKSNFIGNCMHR